MKRSKSHNKPNKFNYIIKIANFYYEDSAKLVKERIMSETNIKNINIDKTSKIILDYLLVHINQLKI